MKRLLALCLFVAAAKASAAPPTDTAKPTAQAELPPAPPPSAKIDREAIRRELSDEFDAKLAKAKAEMQSEIRAQVTTQMNTRALEDDFAFTADKTKLELFELGGYLRLRPELLYRPSLGRGADPAGQTLYPVTPAGSTQTVASTNMRWRLDPILNVSEDIRIRAQLDIFDNLVLGSTPSGGIGLSYREPISLLTTTQLSPSNSVSVKRVWGEVTLPVGQLVFGRMASDWGLGMLANSGNCLDCNYGDTVDRILFSLKVPNTDFYIVPMLGFVSEGSTRLRAGDLVGQPYDEDQSDDVRDAAIAIAKRDTKLEQKRKLDAGQSIVNYGLYLTRRTQDWDTSYNADGSIDQVIPRKSSLWIPDVWFKLQTTRLRIEAEAAGVFGTIGTLAPLAATGFGPQEITVQQFGGVVQSEYEALKSFNVGLEVGFASGDSAPGMGNRPGLGVTQAGSIDGAQWCVGDLATCPSPDNKITNFRFNRDYQVDLILWRELFQGITDAIYVKPGFRYELADGVDVWTNFVYSRAVESTSVPASHLDDNGKLVGDANLGFEIDAGLRYRSGDGFFTGLSYGILFPLAGLDNYLPTGGVDGASAAHALRGVFAIQF